jgi:hypothetical protein
VNVWFKTEAAPEDVQVRACQCGHCRRHGTKTVSDPNGRMEVQAAPGSLRRYRFGPRTADFLQCRECGCYMGAVITIEGRTLGVLNAAAALMEPFVSRAGEPVSYDGESTETKIARRMKGWTPAVVVEAMVNA